MRGVNTFQCSASPLFYVHPHFLTECLEEARGEILIYGEESVDLLKQKHFG